MSKYFLKALFIAGTAILLAGCSNAAASTPSSLSLEQEQILSEIYQLSNISYDDDIKKIKTNGHLSDFLAELSSAISGFKADDANIKYALECGFNIDDKIEIVRAEAEKFLNTQEYSDFDEMLYKELSEKYLYSGAEDNQTAKKADDDLDFRKLYIYLSIFDNYCVKRENDSGEKKVLSIADLDKKTLNNALDDLEKAEFFDYNLQNIIKKYT